MSAPAPSSVLLHRYLRPSSLDAALLWLAEDPQARPIAGGTDLVPLTRARLRSASTLIDLGALQLAGVERAGNTLILGAGTTAAEAARHPLVEAHAPLVVQALRAGASAQIRERATLGGNLLQAPRCPWFRSGSPGCNRREPGSGCDAQAAGSAEGDRWLAIHGVDSQCAASATSDLAVVLHALHASVELRSRPGRTRLIPLDDLWCDGARRPGVSGSPSLAPGELITALHVPLSTQGRELVLFEKVRDRASFDFALVSVAMRLRLDGERIVEASASAGGVAPFPWRLTDVEAALRDRQWSTLDPAQAASHATGREAGREVAREVARGVGREIGQVNGPAVAPAVGEASHPPSPARRGNAFKARLLARTVERALLSLREETT